MDYATRENYLATEIMTAPPQKLHLMLIEAAIRSSERARQHWSLGEAGQASESLIHAQDIVGEMLASLNAEGNADLTKKLAALYIFVFRSLMEANVERDPGKLDGAIRVLEIERDTWRQVCQQLGSTSEEETPAEGLFSTNATGPIPPVFDPAGAAGETCTGFSLEA
jgi:flagellar protein FliS